MVKNEEASKFISILNEQIKQMIENKTEHDGITYSYSDIENLKKKPVYDLTKHEAYLINKEKDRLKYLRFIFSTILIKDLSKKEYKTLNQEIENLDDQFTPRKVLKIIYLKHKKGSNE